MTGLRARPSVWLSGLGATPAVLAATGRPWLAVVALAFVAFLLGLTLIQDLRSQERREQSALLLASVAKEANADPAAVLRAVQPDSASGADAGDDPTSSRPAPCPRPPRRPWTVRPRR